MHSRTTKRIVFSLAAATLACAVYERPASAFIDKTICSNITCTGGKPSFPSSGGLAHPEIVPIFWGPGWVNGGYSGYTREGFLSFIQDLVNGPYFGALEQYGMKSIRMVPSGLAYTATTPSPHCNNGMSCTSNSCSDNSACGFNDVQTVINYEIGQNAVPAPSPYVDMVYMVFLPPGTMSVDYNEDGKCDSSCGSAYNGISYHFAYASSDYAGVSHELVEKISNVQDSNCKNSTGLGSGQIADICQCYTSSTFAGTVDAYWSSADSACVIPDSWTNVWQYTGVGTNWTIIGNNRRHVDAGGYGLISTDTNNNVYLFGGGTNWTNINPPVSNQYFFQGSMFAVGSGGSSSIIALDGGGSNILEYTGTPGFWTPIWTGGASSVLAGANLLATDVNGTLAYYGSGTWNVLAGAADQWVADNQGVAGLSLDHQGVYLNTQLKSNTWVPIGSGGFSELFMGFGTGLAATVLSPRNVYYYPQNNGNWPKNGGPAAMFAITTDNFLYGLASNLQTVIQSSNTAATMPGWPTVGGPANRLIGHGTQLYAVQGISY